MFRLLSLTEMVTLLAKSVLRLALIIGFVYLATFAGSAQTPAELRDRYGVPQMSQLKHGRPSVERYLVRPNILMTIRFTKQGLPCDAVLEPVPSSTPNEGQSEHPPEGDYMLTAEVIKLINELVPLEKRGKMLNEASQNGGDSDMKLHHPGCWGAYFAFYENVSFMCSTWCWGGTFSATIHWGRSTCQGQRIKL